MAVAFTILSTPVTSQRLAKVGVPVLLLGCLLALTCSQRPNWGVPPAERAWTTLHVASTEGFSGALETPLIAQRDTFFVVSGWAAANAQGIRVVKTEIILDGVVVATGTDLIPRADIAAASKRPDFGQSGWRYILSTKNLQPGEHELRLRAIGSDGSSGIVFNKPLTVLQ